LNPLAQHAVRATAGYLELVGDSFKKAVIENKAVNSIELTAQLDSWFDNLAQENGGYLRCDSLSNESASIPED